MDQIGSHYRLQELFSVAQRLIVLVDISLNYGRKMIIILLQILLLKNDCLGQVPMSSWKQIASLSKKYFQWMISQGTYSLKLLLASTKEILVFFEIVNLI